MHRWENRPARSEASAEETLRHHLSCPATRLRTSPGPLNIAGRRSSASITIRTSGEVSPAKGRFGRANFRRPNLSGPAIPAYNHRWDLSPPQSHRRRPPLPPASCLSGHPVYGLPTGPLNTGNLIHQARVRRRTPLRSPSQWTQRFGSRSSGQSVELH